MQILNQHLASAGNSGPRVRSDCEMTLELTKSGGIDITLNSRVKALYGRSITDQCLALLSKAGIENAKLLINDSGALPFVLSARLEAAVRKIWKHDFEYLPEMNPANLYPGEKERYRFSRLYLPGNTPSMMLNAALHSPDGIILDLEDSVAPEKKDEARILVRNALRQLDFCGAERMVRINQGKRGLEDLAFVIPHNVNLILIPKCESASEIKAVADEIALLRKNHSPENNVWLMPIIESAVGVENAYNIAVASPDIVAMAVGLEDLTADLGVPRTNEGAESFYARTRIVNASKAARVQPIDSVFSDVADMEALAVNVRNSKALGFEGMGCIHPRQIAVIKKGFAPDETEIEKSKKIVLAFEEATRLGLGVVALGSKMIDPPVVARAQKTINLALKLGLISSDWMKFDIVEP
jgi:citrate lyase subunit beta / citryl-CoA lyase